MNMQQIIHNLQEVGFIIEPNNFGGIRITHPNVDEPVCFSKAIMIMNELIKGFDIVVQQSRIES